MKFQLGVCLLSGSLEVYARMIIGLTTSLPGRSAEG